MKKNVFTFYRLLTLSLCFIIHTITYCQCGSERWPVKTLNDSEANDINYTPVSSSVHKQLQFPKPEYHEKNARDVTEKKVYRIKCVLVKYMMEGDKDWHLVVKDLATNDQMVVEIPDLNCIDQSNLHFNKIEVSRNRLKAKVGPVKTTPRVPPVGTKLEIVGVGFFDRNNHPPGFKGREIHPVLELKVL
jgi:hypothetical protein